MIKRSGPCRTRRRLRGGLALAAVAAGGALAGEASAGDLGVALEDALTDPSPSHFYANLGPGVLLFDAGATVKEHGVALPGATIKLDPNTTLISEVGYRVGSFGVSLTGGIPPEVKIEGAGSLSPLGALGRLRYGPTTLTVHYHFNPSGRFRPYVGAGPVFLVIFKDHDGAVQQLNVHANTGVVLQAGAEFATSSHWGLFFDAKKALLRTNASAVRGLSNSGTENLHKLAVTPRRHRIARIQAKQGGPQHRLGGMPAGGEPERSRGRSAQLAERIELSLNLAQSGAARPQASASRCGWCARADAASGALPAGEPTGSGLTATSQAWPPPA